MAIATFQEGQSYYVHELYILDTSGDTWSMQDVTVVFTAGWALVHKEGDDDVIVPRERVRLAKGVQPSTSEPWAFAD